MVSDLLEDLLGFLQRDYICPITKIAVGHSQFECIHPFADGNGRTGRAMSLSLLTHSGFPPVPMSAGMLAATERYYKTGRNKQIWEILEILELSETTEETTKRQMLNQQQQLWQLKSLR